MHDGKHRAGAHPEGIRSRPPTQYGICQQSRKRRENHKHRRQPWYQIEDEMETESQFRHYCCIQTEIIIVIMIKGI